MKFPLSIRYAKGVAYRMGLLKWRSVAVAKRAALTDSISWLIGEDRSLFDSLKQDFNDLDWMLTQVAQLYFDAHAGCRDFTAKLDGTGEADASREDIQAFLKVQSAVHAGSVLVSLTITKFGEEIAPKLHRYQVLVFEIGELLNWDKD